MSKTERLRSPEEMFAVAMRAEEIALTPADRRLLSSGIAALRERYDRPVNANEQKSLAAIVAYAAHKQKKNEETVNAMVAAEFGVPDLGALPARHYHEALTFLVDLDVEKSFN